MNGISKFLPAVVEKGRWWIAPIGGFAYLHPFNIQVGIFMSLKR
jgi:hypothetical protein